MSTEQEAAYWTQMLENAEAQAANIRDQTEVISREKEMMRTAKRFWAQQILDQSGRTAFPLAKPGPKRWCAECGLPATVMVDGRYLCSGHTKPTPPGDGIDERVYEAAWNAYTMDLTLDPGKAVRHAVWVAVRKDRELRGADACGNELDGSSSGSPSTSGSSLHSPESSEGRSAAPSATGAVLTVDEARTAYNRVSKRDPQAMESKEHILAIMAVAHAQHEKSGVVVSMEELHLAYMNGASKHEGGLRAIAGMLAAKGVTVEDQQ